MSDLSRKKTKALPEKSFVPDLVTTVISPPVARPYSALKLLVVILNSPIASMGKFCRASPISAQVLFTPSTMKAFA